MIDMHKQKFTISIGFGIMMTLSFFGIGTAMYQINALPVPTNHGLTSDNLIQLSTPKFLGPPIHVGGCHNPCLDHPKPGQVCPLYCLGGLSM